MLRDKVKQSYKKSSGDWNLDKNGVKAVMEAKAQGNG
jgi:hypothetical protein